MAIPNKIAGDQNVVIQGVKDGAIAVNVNGAVEEIHKSLAALKAFMEAQGKTMLQVGEKIYNIGEIGEALFGTILKEVQNALLGNTIHAGSVQVGNNYYHTTAAPKTISKNLTTAPFLPEEFLGREEELRAIEERLFSNQQFLLLVNGEGGIGKTSLASKFYHTYYERYLHTAWVLSERSIKEALLSLAHPLGLVFEETLPTAQRFEQLLATLAGLPAPCLLVIDNANDIEDLEATYQYLRRCANFHLLLTTRITSFERAKTYRIKGLSENEGLALFENYFRALTLEEKVLFSRIREAIGGNTLVLELLAKNLRTLNKGLKNKYTLVDLLNDLYEKGLLGLSKIDEVRADYHSKGQMRREKPDDIIAAMYDLGDLSLKEIELLSIFAVLPPESLSFKVLETLLPNIHDLEQQLLSLVQKGWIEHNIDIADFKCSPVVQEVTRRKNTNLRDDCQKLINVLNEILKYEAGTGHLLNISYYDALFWVRLAEIVSKGFATSDIDLSYLCERIGNYHKTTGNLEKALLFFRRFSELQKVLCKIEPANPNFINGLGISYSRIGETYRALGNIEEALTFFELDADLSNDLHRDFPENISFKNGLAISYEKLGDAHKSLGNLNQALIFLKTKIFFLRN